MLRGFFLVLLASSLVACAAPPAATPAAGTAPPSQDAAALFPLLGDVHRLLVQDHLSVAALAESVGTIAKDPGAPLPTVIRPRLPGLTAARIFQQPRGVIATLELDFAPSARPTIEQLRGLFGEDRVVLFHLHGERMTMFYPRAKGRHFSVVVTATAARCAEPHPQGDACDKLDAASLLQSLELRRDPEP